MEDEEDVRQVADEYVQRWGFKALRILWVEESMARERGDQLSADTWRDIAKAAEKIVGGGD